MYTRKNGFTLIELLVVISIIALLISLLLPALGQAKENGRQIQCGSRMHQLFLAINVYAQDNNGWITPMQVLHRDSGIEQSWRSLLWEYISQEPDLVDCPSEDVERYALGPPDVIGQIDPQETFVPSGIGAVNVHYNNGKRTRPPIGRGPEYGPSRDNLSKFDDIEIPGQTIMLGDGNSNARGAFPEDRFWIYKDIGDVTGPGFSRAVQRDPGYDRHFGKANYTFADGHVALKASNELRCDGDVCQWTAQADPHDAPRGGRRGGRN